MKAFTLTEILIILGIIATLSGLGIWGMIVFRNVVQVQNASSELLSHLQSAANKARNSVPSDAKTGNSVIDKRVDGYAIFFTQSNYSLHYCLDQNSATGSFNCSGVEESNLKLKQYEAVNVTPPASELPRCRGIMFERLTGKIYSMQDFIAVPVTTGVCNVKVSHVTSGTEKTVVLNFNDNIFYIN